MDSSKEDLIEMSELTSPAKKHPRLRRKKWNKIHSPPFASPARSTSEKDVTSLFSVKSSSRRLSSNGDDTETISEVSDDVLSESLVGARGGIGSGGSSARSQIRSKEKINKFRKSLEKIRRESNQVDANIRSLRSKFQLDEKRSERLSEFSFFHSDMAKLDDDDDDEEQGRENDQPVQYLLPENLKFNMELADRDSLVTKTGRSLVRDDESYKLPSPVALRSIKPETPLSHKECTVYYPPHQLSDLEEVLIIKNNILELSLLNIRFSHHPLFSVEHVLQEKLRYFYGKYLKDIENNSVEKMKEELRTLRNSHGAVKEIRKIRETLFEEAKLQRENLKLILNIWKTIKKLRSDQKYSNTNVRLIIKKEKSELVVEKEDYVTFFSEMLQDVMAEHEATYQRKLKQYNRRLKAKKGEMSNESLESDRTNKEETVSDLEKPVLNIDKNKIEAQLRAKFEESFRPPGEPRVTLYLNYDHELTGNVDNEQEVDRRKVLSTTKFTVKITCNGMLVCKSKPTTLNENFVLEVDEIFQIQLTDVPAFLNLEVYEHPKGSWTSGSKGRKIYSLFAKRSIIFGNGSTSDVSSPRLLKKKIADLKIQIPHTSISYSQAEYIEVPFERREIVHYKHAGVGSGYTLKKILEENDVFFDSDIDPSELHTRGILVHKVGWQAPQLKSPSLNGDIANGVGSIINKWGLVDYEYLQRYLEDTGQEGLETIKETGLNEFLASNGGSLHMAQQENRYFRLSPLVEEFCKIEEIENNIRLQYLKLRDQNEIEFDGITIPNRIREIPLSLIKDFKKRKAKEEINEEEADDDPDNFRDAGKRRLKQIHTRIFHTCKGLNDNLSYQSVVDEKYLIYFEELIKISLRNFLNWFRWQPKLSKSLPRLIKNPNIEETQKSQNKILIQIMSSKNIPQRKLGGNIHVDIDEVIVQPFLEISYEDFSTRTSVKTGSNPVWNELVQLPLNYCHADYLNPNALNSTITVNLFDRVKLHSATSNEEFVEHNIWMGEIKIPLAALTTGLNLCGWFKVTRPIVLFGYENLEEQHQPHSPKRVIERTSSDETYVQMDLRVSPGVPLLEPNMADLPSNDAPYIKDHILKWTDVFNSTFPSKKINALAIDTNGRTNCITRFLRPLEPPQLLNEDHDITPEQCLRYVSLIPFTECNQFYQNVWLTTEQLLNFMVGSVIDHCVALTCFLLALRMDAYLLLGYGIPHGSTGYVLISEHTRDSDLPIYFILDVVNNEKFNLADPFCPLQRVYCIVNGENVWGNTQRTQNRALLRFDLSRRSDWWPLFDHNVSAPTNFVNNKINFAETRDFEDLETQLERKLKRKLSKWRPMEKTNFNRRLAEVLKNGLHFLEMNAVYGRGNAEAIAEINKALSQFNVNGIILNIPFTSIHSIIKKVKSLNIHIQPRGITDFGLSVFLQSYAGQVISLWVFIGVVSDKFI